MPLGGTIYESMIWILSGVVGVVWAMLLYETGLIASNRMVGVGYCIFFFLFEFNIDLIHSFHCCKLSNTMSNLNKC